MELEILFRKTSKLSAMSEQIVTKHKHNIKLTYVFNFENINTKFWIINGKT